MNISLTTLKPYPGLRPFESHEVDIFFGRETQVDELLKRLQRERFLAIFGSSGCGKSSLVRAGMIPALEAGFMAPEGADWRITIMRPGENPFKALAKSLLKPNALQKELGESAYAALMIEAELRKGPLGLVNIKKQAELPKQANLLLLVDQFEEIFRFRKEKNTDESDAFIQLLLRSFQEKYEQIFIVLTMRSDFLGNCAIFGGLPEAINSSQYLTPRLTRVQCREAIIGPAKVFGGNIDPQLVNTLLNDFGTDPDQLPLLQHALMHMWTLKNYKVETEQIILRPSDYSQLNGMVTALSDHADQVYDSLATFPQGQLIAEKMFRRLSFRTNEGQEIRSPASVEEIANISGCSPDDVIYVANAFRAPDCCFLMPPSDVPLTAEKILDISHESLIRQWQRMTNFTSKSNQLDGWVAGEAKLSITFQELSRRAKKWKNQGKHDGPVLTGSDLKEAEEWSAKLGRQIVPWLVRYCGSLDKGKLEAQLIFDFIADSKKDEKYHSWKVWVICYQMFLGLSFIFGSLGSIIDMVENNFNLRSFSGFLFFSILLTSAIYTIIGMHRRIHPIRKAISLFTNSVFAIVYFCLGAYFVFKSLHVTKTVEMAGLLVVSGLLFIFGYLSLLSFRCLKYQQKRN